jgi:ketosteroid isomerase-like protein
MMAGGRALVEQFYNQFNSGDLDKAMELFAPDVVTVEPLLGRTEDRDVWRNYDEAFRRACPDAQLVVRSAVEEADRVAVEGTLVGTFTETLDGPAGPRSADGTGVQR